LPFSIYRNNIFSLGIILSMIMLFFVSLSFSDAHILIVGDSKSDFSLSYEKALNTAHILKSKGYPVLELYRKDATSKNIIKGMYNADAIIYAGHGGYMSGHYDLRGGTSSPPFALMGSDNFIWGIGDKMREGWKGPLFNPPYKKNIPVIMLNTCFSTGYVCNREVANPFETVYHFSRMFKDANFYASTWIEENIVNDFMAGAKTFRDANNRNYEVIKSSDEFKGVLIWRNAHGRVVFIGNWNDGFPPVEKTSIYADQAAEKWYQSLKNT
jgi:hypothetical protein